MSASTHLSNSTGIRVVSVRVLNFRSLRCVEVNLDRITVLVGANNGGKTSFLDAMVAAMGAGRRVLNEEDIHLGPNETKPPKERSIAIDILIRPVDEDGNIIDTFPSGSYWTSLWGDGINADNYDNEFMAFRVQLKWESHLSDYNCSRIFLTTWPDSVEDWDKAECSSRPISNIQTEPMALNFMDAKRDIDEDLRHQSSFLRRLTNDLGLEDKDVEEFDQILTDINQQIIDKSGVLNHLKNSLNGLRSIVSSESAAIELAPIARRLRDLTKGISINFCTDGAQTFPLIKHGMGTRSLASLLVFRAFMEWRIQQDNGSIKHPMLALEEPEAHLHPQAQKAIFSHIDAIPGQLIVSTHSPYIAGQARLQDLRLFRKIESDSHVAQINAANLQPDDLRKVNRAVMNTRGDLLYARAVVLFEGETEEQALPIFAEAYYEQNLFQVGINFVSVDGSGKYLPFLRLSHDLQIQWYIFSDGEQSAISDVSSAVKNIGIEDVTTAPNVIFIPDLCNFESYLCKEGYFAEIENMLVRVEGKSDFVEDYIRLNHGQKLKGDKIRDYESDGGRERALLDILKGGKTKYGAPIASEISSITDENRRFPSAIRSLFEGISRDLGIPVRETK